jgi:hypothetical protein
MSKTTINLIFGTIILFASSLQAKAPKVDEILIVQKMISQAYAQGYVDSAPIEMSAVEKKVILAKEAKKKRNKKLFSKLIREIKSDLEIIEKRSEVNKLNLQLSAIQNKNLENQQILDELKEQL